MLKHCISISFKIVTVRITVTEVILMQLFKLSLLRRVK